MVIPTYRPVRPMVTMVTRRERLRTVDTDDFWQRLGECFKWRASASTGMLGVRGVFGLGAVGISPAERLPVDGPVSTCRAPAVTRHTKGTNE
ncbi:hypothetical protein GCM10027039_24840 [Terrabacter koreensis]